MKINKGSHLKSVCVIGTGRMGAAIHKIMLTHEVHCFQYSRLNKENLEDFSYNLQASQGVVDASHADNIEYVLATCLEQKKPYLCCTTGLNELHFANLKKAGQHIPVLYAANTSLGIAILKKAVAFITKALGPDAVITIREKHHQLKKDAPSGTALELGKVVSQNEYPQERIRYESIREGEIVGEHLVEFIVEDEIIQLNHECLNRDVFAKGAIKAAEWLFNQRPGFYSLNDVLGVS